MPRKYAFRAGQLHFYRSHALTTLGESRAAWQAQDDAIAAFGPGERLDPTLVRLDRALCMVHVFSLGFFGPTTPGFCGPTSEA
ncbi:hypothetical protein DMB66_57865 [Actinoplanes sp. ATCC 53533]|nr:hypothetical protein DMB66_57865 [Actinoplanes sp. ATCC 53533]